MPFHFFLKISEVGVDSLPCLVLSPGCNLGDRNFPSLASKLGLDFLMGLRGSFPNLPCRPVGVDSLPCLVRSPGCNSHLYFSEVDGEITCVSRSENFQPSDLFLRSPFLRPDRSGVYNPLILPVGSRVAPFSPRVARSLQSSHHFA